MKVRPGILKANSTSRAFWNDEMHGTMISKDTTLVGDWWQDRNGKWLPDNETIVYGYAAVYNSTTRLIEVVWSQFVSYCQPSDNKEHGHLDMTGDLLAYCLPSGHIQDNWRQEEEEPIFLDHNQYFEAVARSEYISRMQRGELKPIGLYGFYFGAWLEVIDIDHMEEYVFGAYACSGMGDEVSRVYFYLPLDSATPEWGEEDETCFYYHGDCYFLSEFIATEE